MNEKYFQVCLLSILFICCSDFQRKYRIAQNSGNPSASQNYTNLLSFVSHHARPDWTISSPAIIQGKNYKSFPIMTYSDDYLVQKLREILLKLYPTPQTSPTIHENPKFPKLFLTLEEEPELNLFQSQEHLKPGENGKIEMGQFQDETILSQNKTLVSDWERLEENDAQFVGGVVHNVSTLDHLSDNSSLILGKVTNSSPKRDTTLHRDLHHFIQKLLKMSLSQSEGGGSGVWGDGGASGVRDINQDNVPVPGTARVELGPRDLEFNLTLDDIMDLNMLFDGSENVLQFKHVLIIFLYFLIAVVSIVGNLLVVQVRCCVILGVFCGINV